MKKIIALLLALMLVFALAACNNNADPNGDDPLNRDPGTSQGGTQGGEDNPGTQGGEDNPGTQGGEDNPGTQGGEDGSAKLDKFNEKVNAMPTSTDINEIATAIDDVFGVKIDLPNGSYSAQAMSAESATAYIVYVSGSNMTASDYYNSLKSKMTADGYTTIDEDLAFYKAVDGLVYSVGLDSEGRDFYIGFAADVYSGGDIGTPDNNNNPGTQNGGIQTGGEVGASAPKSFELPTNVKLVMEDQTGGTTTSIKIGNDYYYCNVSKAGTSEKYFKYDAENDNYVFYTRYDGGAWQIDDFYTGNNAKYDQMIKQSFGYTNLANGYVNSNPNDGGYSITTTGRSQKIAGVDTKEYKTDASYNAETFWLTDSGICLGYSGAYATETATEWDTSVTSFGVDLP